MLFSKTLLAIGAIAVVPTVAEMEFPKDAGGTFFDSSTPITSILVVDSDVEICDLDLKVDISHTWSADVGIEIELVNDMGMKMTTIIDANGNACGSDDNVVEIFDDNGADYSGPNCDANGVNVKPDGLLSAFNNYNVGGTWTLSVSDNAGGDAGNLNSWSLIVTPCVCEGQGCGDPHFQDWLGGWYDFHGQCDLVYLDNPEFAFGAGLFVHIRTAPRYQYSYIESAVIKIGEDTFEVGSFGDYFLNGVRDAEMPASIGGFTVTHEIVNKKKHNYLIDLGEGQQIQISSFKDLVSVKSIGARYEHFKNSVGLLGKFGTGKHLGRNGTVIEDADAFGNEWQVLSTEPMLFETTRHPQHPIQCVMPSATSESRRLGATIAKDTAEEACAHWGDMKDMCVSDVMAMDDLEIAAGAW